MRKEEEKNFMSRCNNLVNTDDTWVKYDESTAVSILYYHSITAKDTIRGDLKSSLGTRGMINKKTGKTE
jgi:hypothetical protein